MGTGEGMEECSPALISTIVEEVIKQIDHGKRPSIEVLRLAVQEQRRVYDEVNIASQQVRVRILTLVGAGLALLTYLYSNQGSSNPLFIPSTLYGKIFYMFGLLLTLGSIGLLLFATKPGGTHELPTESVHLSNLTEKDEYAYLEYLKDRYLQCYQQNSAHYSSKFKLLNLSFLPLVFGATILIVLKTFGT